ncbi:MAG: LamG domain-containing protein [Nanoarchaeota archaeon]|nr:LamG domain-containing protein [Nanoarchaeota archaeon]
MSENISLNVDLSPLDIGIYSGQIVIETFNDCNFQTGPFLQPVYHPIKIPLGFAKLYDLTVNFSGTPSGAGFYLNHNNKIIMVDSNGIEKRYGFYEYGQQSNYTYTIYSLDRNIDLMGQMIESSYHPTYDKLNVNYFINHLDLGITKSVVFKESNAQHIQQNIVQTAISKNLEVYGIITEVLDKNNYYANNLYYFHPWIGPFSTIDFGIETKNVNNLFSDGYMVSFSPHARDIGENYTTTQNYMILPLVINSPFTNLNKIIGVEDLKNIPLTTPNSLTSYFNNNFRFGVNSYSPFGYWSDTAPKLINIPRDGKFYYLDNCDECYYHYQSYIWDSSSGNNAYIWSNYFDGIAKYIPETTNEKPSFVSFFEDPLRLDLETEHCLQYSPGSYYYCGDDVLKGFLNDKFDAKSHLMTQGTSGNLTIRTPSGATYSVLSDDNSVLAFGQFGSWIIDCTRTSLSFPPVLNNPAFCEDGIYDLMWEMPDVVNGGTLKLSAEVEHSRGNFTIRSLETVEVALQVFYKFDEITNGKTSDSSIHRRDADVFAVNLLQQGKIDGALNFSGWRGRVLVEDTPFLYFDEEMTISAWVNTRRKWKTFQTIVWKGNPDGSPGSVMSDNREFALFLAGVRDPSTGGFNSKVQLAFTPENRIGIGQYACTTNTFPIRAENWWYHIAGVIDVRNQVMKIFVDGVEVKRCVLPNISNIRNTNGLLVVGNKMPLPANSSAGFTGMIDDFRLYNRVLSDAEILELAQR